MLNEQLIILIQLPPCLNRS